METSLCTCGHLPHIFACWGDNGECACREHADASVQKVDTPTLIPERWKDAYRRHGTTPAFRDIVRELGRAEARLARIPTVYGGDEDSE